MAEFIFTVYSREFKQALYGFIYVYEDFKQMQNKTFRSSYVRTNKGMVCAQELKRLA